MTRPLFATLLLLASFPVVSHAQIDPELLAGMKARAIGPAAMSGRVAAIDAVESNPDIIYAGAATGGIWKSTDAGLTWSPVFEDQPVAAIGALAIFQPSPDIVWAGTGESNTRNSMSVGNGVYKSLDGGRTWKNVGLEKSERIARIVTHPSNPNIAWVAATGTAWSENSERGVFKTEDGGKSWKKVLYVDTKTGAADLIIDPSNPMKLFASMWEFRRWPWFFHSGGPGSGLHVSRDGGETWTRYAEDDGMPEGHLGRIGIAIARSNPEIVYALVEAEKSALLRSDNGGRTWKSVNTEADIAPRPFYYADIRVDPADPNRVYNIWSLIGVSNDGGKSFEILVPFRKVHPDHHAMWINPADPSLIIEGNDGGVAISHDRGRSWRFASNLPLGQYYHIDLDMEMPYNIYGGMQDNGSWRGPSSVWENGGIRNHHWQEVLFGDGFRTIPITGDSKRGYAMSQEGYIHRWDLTTGEKKDIRPASPSLEAPLRFNWNAGIAVDPFDRETVYFGSQFLHKSTDRGESWTTISSDLTSNKKVWQRQDKTGGLTPDVTGAENFTTIIAISPSPLERGLIWVGTDDGRLHVTRDGGTTWTSVEGNLKGVPANTWIPNIKPSTHDAATAFVVLDDHRRTNWSTYLYRTTDYGKTWTSLATKDVRGYALAVEQDPVDRDLLFLGTEFGLFVSVDGGKGWMQWRHGVPTVSTMSLRIHPREHDLVIGTHGRAAFVLDDIRPLRSISKETMAKPVHLFDIPDAQQYRVSQTGGERFPGDTEFRGENRPYGALITFSLNDSTLPHPRDENERERKAKERDAKRKPVPVTGEGVPQEVIDVPKPGQESAKPSEEKKDDPKKGPQVEIRVSDMTGKLIRTFKAPAKQGVNRAVWSLRRTSFKEPPREAAWWNEDPEGAEVMPGTYKVTVRHKEGEATGTVRVVADPRFTITDSDREKKWTAIARAGALQEGVADSIERIQKTRADLTSIKGRLKKAPGDEAPAAASSTSDATKEPVVKATDDPIVAAVKKLEAQLDTIERLLWIPPKTKGYVPETDALSKISYVQSALESSWSAPTAAQLTYLAQAESRLGPVLTDLNRFYAEDVARFRELVRSSKLEWLQEVEPVKIK